MKRVVLCRVELERDGRCPGGDVGNVDQRGMNEFMSSIDVFLKQRARKLLSFALMFQVEAFQTYYACTLSKENGRRMPYNAFFHSVLELLDIDDIRGLHSEGLELCLEFGFRQHVNYKYDGNYWTEEKFWEKVEKHCPKTNDVELDEEHWRGSEDITQLICEIMNKIKENRRGDKLIVKCSGLDMTGKRGEFLRFWIPGDNIKMGWDEFELVLQ